MPSTTVSFELRASGAPSWCSKTILWSASLCEASCCVDCLPKNPILCWHCPECRDPVDPLLPKIQTWRCAGGHWAPARHPQVTLHCISGGILLTLLSFRGSGLGVFPWTSLDLFWVPWNLEGGWLNVRRRFIRGVDFCVRSQFRTLLRNTNLAQPRLSTKRHWAIGWCARRVVHTAKELIEDESTHGICCHCLADGLATSWHISCIYAAMHSQYSCRKEPQCTWVCCLIQTTQNHGDFTSGNLVSHSVQPSRAWASVVREERSEHSGILPLLPF